MQESAIFKDEITKTLKSGAPVPVPGLFLEMVNCVLWRVGKSVFNPTRDGNILVYFSTGPEIVLCDRFGDICYCCR